MWSWLWRNVIHGKDEVLRLKNIYTEQIPIAPLGEEQREGVHLAVQRLASITAQRHAATRVMLDWLKIEYEIAKPTLKLQSPADLDADAFVAEMTKARGKVKTKTMTATALAALREEHARTLAPARAQAAEALTLERKLSDLVNAAYGLTPDEVKLMWKTAPPRTPLIPNRRVGEAG